MFNYSKFITEIQSKRPIWDTTHENYNDSKVTDKIWLEVESKFGFSNACLRKKWIGLYNTFTKEVMRQNMIRKKYPDMEQIKPKWKYFMPLLFLKDHIEIDDSNEFELKDEYGIDGNIEYNIKQIKCESNDMDYQTLEMLGQRELSNAEKHEIYMSYIQDNEDLLFFQSLVPLMKSLSDKDNLSLKTKIQKLVKDFVFKDKSSK